MKLSIDRRHANNCAVGLLVFLITIAGGRIASKHGAHVWGHPLAGRVVSLSGVKSTPFLPMLFDNHYRQATINYTYLDGSPGQASGLRLKQEVVKGQGVVVWINRSTSHLKTNYDRYHGHSQPWTSMNTYVILALMFAAWSSWTANAIQLDQAKTRQDDSQEAAGSSEAEEAPTPSNPASPPPQL